MANRLATHSRWFARRGPNLELSLSEGVSSAHHTGMSQEAECCWRSCGQRCKYQSGDVAEVVAVVTRLQDCSYKLHTWGSVRFGERGNQIVFFCNGYPAAKATKTKRGWIVERDSNTYAQTQSEQIGIGVWGKGLMLNPASCIPRPLPPPPTVATLPHLGIQVGGCRCSYRQVGRLITPLLQFILDHSFC